MLVVRRRRAGPADNLNVEIYYPPYLYDAAGALATRPAITSAPSAIDIGETFGVRAAAAPAAISRVTLVKTGSVRTAGTWISASSS